MKFRRFTEGNINFFGLSIALIINVFAINVNGLSTAVIKTTSGPVQGEILRTVGSVEYATFKGIRYGQPPIGYLRFKPPVAVKPWRKILNATVEGNDCIQYVSGSGTIRGSEDCLFLNIYSPVTNLESPPKKLKSVMVWIYGGGFTTGTSSYSLYKPDYLLQKDVVFVAFNYRLGPLGFLNINHANATGNAGLKDQVLALKWIKANIAKFGGNPKNVTIFGQSAGAASVGYHVLSDASAGLFNGAIPMSGVPLNPWAFQSDKVALAKAFLLGRQLGIITIDKASLLRHLYRATAAEIVNATARISQVISPFVPTLENAKLATDVFLSKCSVDKYKQGNYKKVPQMIGYLDQETLGFYGVAEPFVEMIEVAIDYVNKNDMVLGPGLSAVKDIIDVGGDVINDITAVTLSAVTSETTDLLFAAHIDQTQQILVEKKSRFPRREVPRWRLPTICDKNRNNPPPIYYYHVSFYTNNSLHNILSNGRNPLPGAAHGDELEYIFYFPGRNFSSDPTDPMARTIHQCSTMWTNFAKYGNPTPSWVAGNDLNITWPDSGSAGTALDIGNELKVGPRPISANAALVQLLSQPLMREMNGCSLCSG